MCLFEMKLQVENKFCFCWSASARYMPINKKHIALWDGRWSEGFSEQERERKRERDVSV